MKAWLRTVSVILTSAFAVAPAFAQPGAKLAVGPNAGGYLCPDGRQLYVKSCYDSSSGASCGIVLMHLPLQRGYQQERTQTRAEITPTIAACKIYPVKFNADGTVGLVVPKAASPQAPKAQAAIATPKPSTTTKSKAAAKPAAVVTPPKAPIRLPETETEKAVFEAIKTNQVQLAVNTIVRSPAGKLETLTQLTDEQGMSALHWAAMNRNAAATRWLLDKHADFDLADKMGRTPLKIALDNRESRVMALLLDRGANAAFALPGHDDELKAFKETSDLVDFMIKTSGPAPD